MVSKTLHLTNSLATPPLDEQSRGSKLYAHHHRAHEVLSWLLDGLEDVLCGGSHCNLMIKGSAACFPDALGRIPDFFSPTYLACQLD